MKLQRRELIKALKDSMCSWEKIITFFFLWLVSLQPGWINAPWNPYSMAFPENSIHLKKDWLEIQWYDKNVQCFLDLHMTVLSFKHHLTISASTEDHSNADCFVCVFLSHGEDGHIFAYDDKIEIQTITDMFRGDKCQSLVGKPKIFIIQVRCLFLNLVKLTLTCVFLAILIYFPDAVFPQGI